MNTLRFLAAAAVAGSALLSGCAAFNTVGSDVTSFGEWPQERAPGTYSFDRLPSQQTAGFRPAEAGAKGEYTVQVGARIDRYEASPWADPFWWPGLYHGFYP